MADKEPSRKSDGHARQGGSHRNDNPSKPEQKKKEEKKTKE